MKSFTAGDFRILFGESVGSPILSNLTNGKIVCFTLNSHKGPNIGVALVEAIGPTAQVMDLSCAGNDTNPAIKNGLRHLGHLLLINSERRQSRVSNDLGDLVQ